MLAKSNHFKEDALTLNTFMWDKSVKFPEKEKINRKLLLTNNNDKKINIIYKIRIFSNINKANVCIFLFFIQLVFKS